MTPHEIAQMAEQSLADGDGLLAKALYFVAAAKIGNDESHAFRLLDRIGQEMMERQKDFIAAQYPKLN